MMRPLLSAAATLLPLHGRLPPGAGGDSPGRRSVTLSPQRRTAGAHTAAAISGLSLGIALGGGGAHGGAAGAYGGGQHGVAGGYSTGGGSPPMSQHEFPIAAVRDPTAER